VFRAMLSIGMLYGPVKGLLLSNPSTVQIVTTWVLCDAKTPPYLSPVNSASALFRRPRLVCPDKVEKQSWWAASGSEPKSNPKQAALWCDRKDY
jgi:hypothetical protein